MKTQCHICLGQPIKVEMIKCKLCCDGLEQETCTYCAKLYNAYKKTFISGHEYRNYYFLELQALRQDGINLNKKGTV